MILRPYQQEMVKAVSSSPHRRVLCEAMTGLGKTVTFSEIARRHDGRVLVLIHREELADQAARTISRMTGEQVGVEMGEQSCLETLWRPRIVVASVQSLVASRRRRLELLAKTPPSLVIVDECHHAAAKTWRSVIERFPEARVVGVTATADRGDKATLGGVFDAVAYKFDAYDAIDQGWLVPLRAATVRVSGLSYAGVRTTAGELNGADLERVLSHERVPQGFAAGLHKFAEDGHKILAFCPSVSCAERVAEICNRRQPGLAAFVSGTTSPTERRDIIAAFRNGTVRILLNCMVLTEGFDCPDTTAVALCGATKSRSRFVQMVGRGLRPLPGVVDGLDTAEQRREAIAESYKTHCLIIDFAGDAGRHSLMGPLDILVGRVPQDLEPRVRKILSDSDEEIDLDEAIEQAKQQAASEAARRAQIVANVTLNVQRALDPRMIGSVPLPAPSRWDVGASERQIIMLARIGIDTRNLTKRQANTLITEAIRRSRDNRATYKQEKLLASLGHTWTELPTRKEASEIIERLMQSRRNKH